MLFTYTDKIKPYVRMTQKGKWSDPQAREYLASKSQLAYAFRTQMLRYGYEPFPAKTPFGVSLTYQAPNIFQFDLDNILKAVMDAANGVVFTDDRWCIKVRDMNKQRGPFALTFELTPATLETRPPMPAILTPSITYAQRSE